MDPFTQSLIGATTASAFSREEKLKKNSLFGALGGIFPDIDVFIKSSNDQLLFVEYHRHFTHSIFFIPFGGFILSIVLFLIFKSKTSFKRLYIYTTIGIATHGLLDAFTTYGTSLFWPLFDIRVAWNVISIVDPIFTLILLSFLVYCLTKSSVIFCRLGLLLSVIYLSFGFQQNQQVKSFINEIADKRGHKVERLIVNPTIGNLILWRSIYQNEGKYYVDAVYFPLLSKPKLKQGVVLNVINKETIFPELGPNSVQRNDIRRFSYFTNDYIYLHPNYEFIISDLRYGSLPNDHLSLWGIEINIEKPENHVMFKNLRNFDEKIYSDFWKMIKGDFTETIK